MYMYMVDVDYLCSLSPIRVAVCGAIAIKAGVSLLSSEACIAKQR